MEYNISKRESENLKSLHPPSFCITRIFRTIDFHCKTGFTFRYLETPAGKTHLPLFLEVNFFFFFLQCVEGVSYKLDGNYLKNEMKTVI